MVRECTLFVFSLCLVFIVLSVNVVLISSEF